MPGLGPSEGPAKWLLDWVLDSPVGPLLMLAAAIALIVMVCLVF